MSFGERRRERRMGLAIRGRPPRAVYRASADDERDWPIGEVGMRTYPEVLGAAL